MNNSGMEVDPNWRISFPENSRVKIIDKIISTLQGQLSGNPKEAINTKDMNRLKNMAYKVEANIHSAANSKEDYMRKIKAALKSIEMKRPGQVKNSLPDNSTGFDQKLLDSGTSFIQPIQVQARPQLLSENIQSSITECSAGFASALSTMPGLSQTGISTLGAQTTAMSNMSGISKNSLNNSTAQVFPQNTLTKSPRYEMQAKQPQQQQKQTQTQHHSIYQQQLQNLQLLSHLQHSVPQQLQPQQSFLEQKQHRQLPAQRTIGAEDQLEMTYQKLQSLKETYLSKIKEEKNFLIEISQKIHLMSPETFKTLASDVGAIGNLTDSMAGSALAGRSKSTVGEDLVDMTRFHLQENNLMLLDSGAAAKKMRRCMSSLPVIIASSDGSLDYSPHCITDFESSKMLSTGTATAKRPRLELDRVLQPEIQNVNEQLFETVVDVSDNDIDAASCEGRDGIVVKFSYNPMSFGRDKHADKSPISPLWLLIPLSYPKCSPVVLDRPPVETIKEYEDLSSKAKAMFDVSVRNLPEPMTLETLARTWDKCARNVVAQYVYQRGGDSFNAQCGPWEYCTSE